MLLVEAIFALGIVILLIRVVPPMLARRAENRRLRDHRRQQIEAAKSAADVVSMLMIDKELAREVLRELGQKVAEEDRN